MISRGQFESIEFLYVLRLAMESQRPDLRIEISELLVRFVI